MFYELSDFLQLSWDFLLLVDKDIPMTVSFFTLDKAQD